MIGPSGKKADYETYFGRRPSPSERTWIRDRIPDDLFEKIDSAYLDVIIEYARVMLCKHDGECPSLYCPIHDFCPIQGTESALYPDAMVASHFTKSDNPLGKSYPVGFLMLLQDIEDVLLPIMKLNPPKLEHQWSPIEYSDAEQCTDAIVGKLRHLENTMLERLKE